MDKLAVDRGPHAAPAGNEEHGSPASAPGPSWVIHLTTGWPREIAVCVAPGWSLEQALERDTGSGSCPAAAATARSACSLVTPPDSTLHSWAKGSGTVSRTSFSQLRFLPLLRRFAFYLFFSPCRSSSPLPSLVCPTHYLAKKNPASRFGFILLSPAKLGPKGRTNHSAGLPRRLSLAAPDTPSLRPLHSWGLRLSFLLPGMPFQPGHTSQWSDTHHWGPL